MIAGYVTYEELKLITGFSDSFLTRILKEGIQSYAIHLNGTSMISQYKIALYDLEEVEEWIRLYIY